MEPENIGVSDSIPADGNQQLKSIYHGFVILHIEKVTMAQGIKDK